MFLVTASEGLRLHEDCTPDGVGNGLCQSGTPKSWCHDGINQCVCKQGYIEQGGVCVQGFHLCV